MWVSDKWTDYELLDCSGGDRLERWGRHILIRPDPQVIWHTPKDHPGWHNADARYERFSSGGGKWHASNLPKSWHISYGELTFSTSLMNFKHTGLFPEQAVNWDFMSDKIQNAGREIEILNLFAYTGGATVATAAAGARVCHVDAARGMVQRARENAEASALQGNPVRWIVDDCVKFVQREMRRGRKYDAIIMDPPSYGRGPGGEIWKIEDDLYGLLQNCVKLLSDSPLFMLVNSYTTGLSASTLTYMAESLLGGCANSSELGLPVSESGLILPCGASCRWERTLG